ncbi:hypothetical protein ASG98_17760 [Bacillus sp. Soil531]|nr:hypothetical protein ASG98_17760 [Bacillus sp. Soil531]
MKVNFSATAFWTFGNSNTKYHGDLYLNKDEGGIIVYIRVPNKGGPKSFFELPLEIPLIKGKTINGAEICLIDCVRTSTNSRIGLEEVYGYKAKYMLEGVTFENKENVVFSKVRMCLPRIIKWGNVSNYVTPDIEDRETLIGLNYLRPIEIYNCEEYTLSYELICSYPFNLIKEEITLKQIPYLIVESNSLHSLDWFVDIIIKMKRLIEIAMGSQLQFHGMIAESPEVKVELDDGYSQIKSIEVIHALTRPSKVNDKIDNETGIKFLFNLNELVDKANFSEWQTNAFDLEPIIELYIDDLYNLELSASRHFLNMIQALETYHSRFICNGTLADYKERVENIIRERPEIYKQEDRDFLLKGSQRSISLRSRISDLLLADYEFRFYTLDWKEKDFPEVIADTRNYYTHYNPRKKEKALKDEKLYSAYTILRNILEYYILKELGFEEKFIHERITERIRPLMTGHQIQKEYERQG